MLVPLHLLLETVELAPLLEGTALMVPLGEAVALLSFSRHFPAALALVTPIEAVQTAAETRPVRPSSAQLLVR